MFYKYFGKKLEIESGFASSLGQCLDATVIEISAAVEHNLLDALLLRLLCDQLADQLGCLDVAAVGLLFTLFALRGGGGKCRAPSRRRSTGCRCG